MRHFITLFLLFGICAFAQHDHSKSQKKEIQKGHAMISLPTIQCETCVQTVESAVKKVNGVKAVSIDPDKKMAHVNFDEKKTSQEKIENAIAAAGYNANKTKRDEAAHAKLPKCCQSKRE
jgi:copper ion binding protein